MRRVSAAMATGRLRHAGGSPPNRAALEYQVQLGVTVDVGRFSPDGRRAGEQDGPEDRVGGLACAHVVDSEGGG